MGAGCDGTRKGQRREALAKRGGTRGRSPGLGLALLVDRIRSAGVGEAGRPGGNDGSAKHRSPTLDGRRQHSA
jgi:hypothetical protein